MAVKNTDRMLNLSRDLSTTGAPNSGGGGGGRRNLVINGAMQVAQRGTQETGITTSGYHTVDRFRFRYGGATFTMDQNTVTDLPGFTKSCKFTCTTNGTPTASQLTYVQTRIEAQNLQHLKKGTSDAESVTLSFWVKSDVTGTYSIELYEDDNTRSIGKPFTVDTAGTWEYKTLTFAGDTTGAITSDNGIGFYLTWFLGAGSNYKSGTFNTSWHNYVDADRVSSAQVEVGDTIGQYFEITGVQLELGDTATPFEHRSYGEELALCQRYYFRPNDVQVQDDGSVAMKYGLSTMTLAFNSTFAFPVKMRAAPSATEITAPGTYTNCSTITFNTNPDGYLTRVNVTSNGFYRAYNWLYEFDAEL